MIGTQSLASPGSFTNPTKPPKPDLRPAPMPRATQPKVAFKIDELSPTGAAGIGALLGAVANRTLAEHPNLSGTARDAAIGAAIALALQHLMAVYAAQSQSAKLPEFAHTAPNTLL